MVKKMQMKICHIVPMADGLDCGLDSSLTLQHLCSWEMIVSIQMLPFDLVIVPGFFFFPEVYCHQQIICFQDPTIQLIFRNI